MTRLKDGRTVVFTPTATRRYQAAVAELAAQHLPAAVLEGPLALEVLFVQPRPGRLRRARDPDGLIWADTRPDLDNQVKAIADGLRTAWRDDRQIAELVARKTYAERQGKPRIWIRIRQLTTNPAGPHGGGGG